MEVSQIPLFPLSVVLFPDGHLPLRIFEQRYLAMVRDCTRNGTPFGVLAVLPGQPGSDAVHLAPVGTAARIVDFYTRTDGLLGIDCVGQQRFRVEGTQVADDGLLIGTVRLLQEPRSQPVPAQFGLLSSLVLSLVEQVGGAPAQSTPAQRDDSLWVARRLAEFLPLELEEKQQLLEMEQALPQLEQLLTWLPRFQAD
jgi:uncharacterized protein